MSEATEEVAGCMLAAEECGRGIARQLMEMVVMQGGDDADLEIGADATVEDVARRLRGIGAEEAQIAMVRPAIRQAFIEEGRSFLSRYADAGGRA